MMSKAKQAKEIIFALMGMFKDGVKTILSGSKRPPRVSSECSRRPA